MNDVDGLISRLLDNQQKAAERVEAYALRMDDARRDLAHSNDLISEAYKAKEDDRQAIHDLQIEMAKMTLIISTSERTAKEVAILSSRLEHLTGRIVGISAGMALVMTAVGFIAQIGMG